MIDPTKGWDKYMFIRENCRHGVNVSDKAHELLDMKGKLGIGKNDCPVWDRIATEILESMSKGEPMEAQRKKIKQVMAHTKTCQHKACVKSRELLPSEFFKDISDEDME